MSFWSPNTHPHTIYLYYSRESQERQLGGSQDFDFIKSLPLVRSKFKVPILGYDAQRLKAGGEWDDRGWDGWMASPTQWTWVLVNSGSWWWTGRPGVLQSMGSQSRTRLSDWTDWIDWMCSQDWISMFYDFGFCILIRKTIPIQNDTF